MAEKTLLEQYLAKLLGRPHGIDHGGWTQWALGAVVKKYRRHIDFVIMGVGWGAHEHPHFEANLPEILKVKRRMGYLFFNRDPAWEAQADFFLKQLERMDARAAWLDWERTNHLPNAGYGVDETKRLGKQASKAWKIIEKVMANFDGPVGLYSNFNDYFLLQQFEFPIDTLPWWAAWPDDNPLSPCGNSWWWDIIDRPMGDYLIDQYSWRGIAADWGATNTKDKMDLNIFNGSMKLLDEFLRIKPVGGQHKYGLLNRHKPR